MNGPTDANPAPETAIKQARVESLVPAIRNSFLSSVAAIVIFGALLGPHSPIGFAIWLGIRVVTSGTCLAVLARAAKSTLPAEQMIRLLTAIMATSGVVWGLIPFLIRPSEPEWRAVVMLWLFGNQSVVTAVCSASRRVFQGATGSVTLVGALGSVLYGDSFGLILAGVLLFGGVYSVSLPGEPFVEGAARADRCLYTVKDQGRNGVALTTVDGQVPNSRDAGRFRGADRLGDGQNRPPPSVVPQS